MTRSDATHADVFTADCTSCRRPLVGDEVDFCLECRRERLDVDRFGRCYQCRDFHDHESCIGVPCECPCPAPDMRALARERDAVLAKLTPAERAILGFP